MERAARILREGGIVAFPTETVYGLGADMGNEEAVRRIYEVKERNFSKPLALHLPDFESAGPFIKNAPDSAVALAHRYLPGPLMIIFEKADSVPDYVTGGLSKVGIRVPSNDAFAALARAFGGPIAATSANKSGALPSSSAEQVSACLDGLIDAVLIDDEGIAGTASTVLDVSCRPFRIVRNGFLTGEMISEALGERVLLSDDGSLSRAVTQESGLNVILVEGDRKKTLKRIKSLYENYSSIDPGTVGLLLTNGAEEQTGHLRDIKFMGSLNEPEHIVNGFFACMRAFEREGKKTVLVEGISREGSGWAVMDRISSAASEIIRDSSEFE